MLAPVSVVAAGSVAFTAGVVGCPSSSCDALESVAVLVSAGGVSVALVSSPAGVVDGVRSCRAYAVLVEQGFYLGLGNADVIVKAKFIGGHLLEDAELRGDFVYDELAEVDDAVYDLSVSIRIRRCSLYELQKSGYRRERPGTGRNARAALSAVDRSA